MGYVELNNCLACGGESLNPVLDLDFQPPANALLKHPADKPMRYPLQTMFCKACAHTQLSVAVDPDELFRDYLYLTGTSKFLVEHMQDLALNYSRVGERSLDIGCNDGTLMRAILAVCPENEVWGIDPALSLGKEQAGLKVMREFFNMETAAALPKFGLVTALNCFAHNPDPASLLLAIKSVLEPDGLAIIEMPYAPKTFAAGQFDQIYHEHYNYFSLMSMLALCKRTGMTVTSAYETTMHGGSMRYCIQTDATQRFTAYDVGTKLRQERDTGAHWYASQVQFAEKARKTIQKIENELIELDKAGYTCIAYGASAKLSVLINAFQRVRDCPLEMVVDDNPHKQGRYTPGVPIVIHSPEILREIGSNLLILCGANNIVEDLKEKVRALRPGAGGDMIMTYWGEGVRVEKI